ncbi:2-oxo-4-hydroxy-4-carboxy-5-ureidoimidazoline decarboxylase [Nonomuraea sp. KC401]|uniref:2-oxo-4-hydroxy-4-carboxy-5-ureidoimidazoline decarboxylase n=1 Tax=unclassified Nonomuraea TaxID=2593643 RepID=UPI0010FCF224|nr:MULTISPECIES: 2-oxo-4-hydroxy-4-carboxy-5-ureidoimidazoline decarboxylase [unclassified Nonomuraea]NBE99342.1 2-oxo-4-hydroxy-4-carboxy-5-ureidoimidazoline decarboxylase [Nonomuraea sp. K271]TLF52428.1 2-oxo-4-hydroxy-4-carboxy-5-ureidoimidazoline decarboxylase [Nonomuraea sp. KC401]
MSDTLSALDAFNTRPHDEAERDLLACCACRAFAAEVAGRRPYRELGALLDAADAAVRELEWPGVLEALGAHPRIGERPDATGTEAAWSRQEQSGVDDASRAALAEGNRAYEERFGHVYLVCATGLSGAELLARLTSRLRNDEESERDVVRAELAAITRLRLAKLIREGR